MSNSVLKSAVLCPPVTETRDLSVVCWSTSVLSFYDNTHVHNKYCAQQVKIIGNLVIILLLFFFTIVVQPSKFYNPRGPVGGEVFDGVRFDSLFIDPFSLKEQEGAE